MKEVNCKRYNKKKSKQGFGFAYLVKIEDVNCYETIFPKCFPPVNGLVRQQKSFSTTANRYSVNQANILESFVVLNPGF